MHRNAVWVENAARIAVESDLDALGQRPLDGVRRGLGEIGRLGSPALSSALPGEKALAGRADVLSVADLVREGFFGPTPVSEAFASRVGNLVILPHLGEGVYWYEKDRFVQKYRGHHGGLTRAEMEIPLLLAPV